MRKVQKAPMVRGWPVSRMGDMVSTKNAETPRPLWRIRAVPHFAEPPGETRRRDLGGMPPPLSGNRIKAGKIALIKVPKPLLMIQPKMAKIPEISVISAFPVRYPGSPVDAGIDGRTPSRSFRG